MYSLTINGNTPEELFKNLEQMVEAYAAPATPAAPFAANPAPAQPPIAPAVPAQNPYETAPSFPTAPPAAPAAMPPVAQTAPAAPVQPAPNTAVPAAAPTYTVEALARAGASLAQSGKMTEALALLAKYGVQTVNQLKAEQYGAFATELRALGAQV